MSHAREELPAAEAHLWYVGEELLDDPGALERYHDLLTPEEEGRRRRFAFDEGRRQHLVTRALVRTRLSRYTGVDPRDWRFAPGERGRPEIAAPGGFDWLRFNLSHTHGRIVCLLARDAEVGVDVEDTGRGGRLLDIADRYFSPLEVRELFALPEAERRPRFFDYWTLKESYIKGRGLGLAIPLERFSFRLDPGAPIRVELDPELGDDASAWQFLRIPQPPRHLVAVAIRRGRGPDRRLVVRAARPLGD